MKDLSEKKINLMVISRIQHPLEAYWIEYIDNIGDREKNNSYIYKSLNVCKFYVVCSM